jgi:hypothetical protein
MSSVFQLAEKATNEYLKNKSVIAKSNIELALTQSKSIFEKRILSGNLKSATTNDVSNSTVFSPIQKKYILMIQSIVADRTLNIDSHLAKIKNIENIVRKECSEKEGAVILGIATVARHSMRYWHDNYLKWITKLESTVVRPLKMNKLKSTEKNGSHLPDGYYAWPDDPHMYIHVVNGYVTLMYCPPGMVFDPDTKMCKFEEKEKSFNWALIADEDINGAIIGAGAALITNIVLGAGQAVYGTTILSTAAAGSIDGSINAIRQYFF